MINVTLEFIVHDTEDVVELLPSLANELLEVAHMDIPIGKVITKRMVNEKTGSVVRIVIESVSAEHELQLKKYKVTCKELTKN